MSTFLDYDGLDLLIKLISDTYINKEEIEKLIISKTFAEWESNPDEVLPVGTILIYRDRSSINEVPVPDLKIANGVTTVHNLPFLVDRDVEQLAMKYIEIKDNNNIDLYFSGSVQDGNEIIRNTQIYANGGNLYADVFHGRLSNSLNIGDLKYDGSKEVTIPVYGGE